MLSVNVWGKTLSQCGVHNSAEYKVRWGVSYINFGGYNVLTIDFIDPKRMIVDRDCV